MAAFARCVAAHAGASRRARSDRCGVPRISPRPRDALPAFGGRKKSPAQQAAARALARYLLADAEQAAAFEAYTPMGRIAEVEEIKGSVLYLASDASSFVTGTVLVIDGGVLAR